MQHSEEPENYEQLKKDADDNNAVRALVKMILLCVVGVVVFLTLIYPVVKEEVDYQIIKRHASEISELQEETELSDYAFVRWYEIERNK